MLPVLVHVTAAFLENARNTVVRVLTIVVALPSMQPGFIFLVTAFGTWTCCSATNAILSPAVRVKSAPAEVKRHCLVITVSWKTELGALSVYTERAELYTAVVAATLSVVRFLGLGARYPS